MSDNKPPEPYSTTPDLDLATDLGDDVEVSDDTAAVTGARLADGVTDDRATGRLCVYDTRLRRYVSPVVDDVDEVRSDYRITRTGRFQLRRV